MNPEVMIKCSPVSSAVRRLAASSLFSNRICLLTDKEALKTRFLRVLHGGCEFQLNDFMAVSMLRVTAGNGKTTTRYQKRAESRRAEPLRWRGKAALVPNFGFPYIIFYSLAVPIIFYLLDNTVNCAKLKCDICRGHAQHIVYGNNAEEEVECRCGGHRCERLRLCL